MTPRSSFGRQSGGLHEELAEGDAKERVQGGPSRGLRRELAEHGYKGELRVNWLSGMTEESAVQECRACAARSHTSA